MKSDINLNWNDKYRDGNYKKRGANVINPTTFGPNDCVQMSFNCHKFLDEFNFFTCNTI